MDTIFSKSNDKVKFIRGLNEKKQREKTHSYYLEGVKVVDEIIEKAIDIKFIAYSTSILSNTNGGEKLLKKIKESNIESYDFEENVFKYMTDTVNTQGVLVVLDIKDYDLNYEIKNEKNNVLVLDRIQDPGNLGTIIRCANAFDINIIICTKDSVDCYTQKVLRSTMGGILNVKVIYVESYDFLNILKENSFSIIATSLNTTNTINNIDYSNKIAFVMGNEAQGISKEIENMADSLVYIPMSKKIESLNVSVATSIILYEQYKNTNNK